jgi:hypothetical protein
MAISMPRPTHVRAAGAGWANSSKLAVIYNGTTASTQLDTASLPLPAPLYQLRLLPDVPYAVRVAARNAKGTSAWGEAAVWRAPRAGACANEPDLTVRTAAARTQSTRLSPVLDPAPCVRVPVSRPVQSC